MDSKIIKLVYSTIVSLFSSSIVLFVVFSFLQLELLIAHIMPLFSTSFEGSSYAQLVFTCFTAILLA